MTTKPAIRRGARGLYKKPKPMQQNTGVKRRSLPEYLEKLEVDALIRYGSKHEESRAASRMLMLLQWRAGLRVSEALAVEAADIMLDADSPTIRVRNGKGGKDRVVPVHPELAAALRVSLGFARRRAHGPIVQAHRATAWRWVKEAQVRAEATGDIERGRVLGTHTLRHSFARSALAAGIPINRVQRWLGHASLSTTLVYLEILPDPLGEIDRVP
jgi:integrase/recombinase XerD